MQLLNLTHGPQLSNWAASHNVFHELLPFEHRKNDPITDLRTLRDHINGWPITKGSYTLPEVDIESFDLQGTNHTIEFTPLPYFMGSYRLEKSQQYRWTNPEYIHDSNLTPKTKHNKETHARRMALLGRFSHRDVARMWNRSPASIRRWVRGEGREWGDYRTEGKRRFARTIETIHKWRGVEWAELARLFGIPRGTLYEWRELVTTPIPDEPEVTP